MCIRDRPFAAIFEWSVRGIAQGRRLRIDSREVVEITVNTLGVGAAATALTILLALPIAFLHGRHRSRVGSLSHAIAISTFAMPGILVALAAIFFINQSDWTFATFHNTLSIVILAYTVRFAGLAMGTTLIAIQAVPTSLGEVARTLGVSRARRFRSIELPLVAPGLLASGGLVLLSTLKELPISLLLSPPEFETLSTRIFGLFGESFVTEAGLVSIVLVCISLVATWLLILRQTE